MILLTGATGFLGKEISKYLNENEIKHSSLSRNNSTYNCNLSENSPILRNKYSVVIHAAGKAHIVPLTEIDKNEFYKTNVNGTLNLLKGIENIGLPSQFVFISSVSVYGQFKGQMIKEDSLLSAMDPYGLSKIQTEKIVSDWCDKNSVICTILRLPLIIGKNPPGNLGDMINAINKGYYFNIAGGQARKSMVLAEDVAMYIMKVAKIGGIYNLTDGIHPNFHELSYHIADQLGKKYIPNMPKNVAKFLAKIGDIYGNKFPINTNKLDKITSTLTFDDSKARTAFGWAPTPVLEGFKIK